MPTYSNAKRLLARGEALRQFESRNPNNRNERRISMDRLKGKVAMVVGAGSIGPGWGNGKATAVTFAREGAQVFCVDRNPAAAEETVGIITKEGGKAMAHHSRRVQGRRGRGDGRGVPEGLWPHRRARQQCRHRRSRQRGRGDGRRMGPRLRGQSQERLSRHEARHSLDGEAGRRLDHQHLLDRLHPPCRHFLCQLQRQQGGDEPDDAHHRGRVRAGPCPRQRDPAGA